MVVTFEWAIIFLGAIFCSAFFSYKSGFKDGTIFGVDTVIQTLIDQGSVEFDEK
jgi:hypothetical protein